MSQFWMLLGDEGFAQYEAEQAEKERRAAAERALLREENEKTPGKFYDLVVGKTKLKMYVPSWVPLNK